MPKGKYHEWLTEEGLGCLEAWARDGLSDEQLAGKMGVSCSTFYLWVKKYSEISEAIRRGRGGARELIENALMKKAMGYTTTVLEPVKLRTRLFNEEKGKFEERETVEMYPRQVHIPPDPRAAQYWLNNRNRDRWAEHPEPVDSESEGKVTVICDV